MHLLSARSVTNTTLCCTKSLIPKQRKGKSQVIPLYAASSKSEEVLLMMCRVQVTSSDGSITQARALLDCAASTSLITERFVQQLCLPQHSSNFTINCVAGLNVHPRGTVSFKVAGVRGGGKQIEVEASVLPKVRPIYPPFPCLRSPSRSTCRDWNLLTLIMELQLGWISC